MDIRIDRSELSSNSLFPTLPNSRPEPGLEELTGADWAISKTFLPINQDTLAVHIQAGTIFVQNKFGYDFIGNFEQIWKEVARIQACKIPMGQAYILRIGHFKPDSDGLLRITGKRPLEHNKSITYQTFLNFERQLLRSGVWVQALNDDSEIESWIEAVLRTDESISSRNGQKLIYPQRPKIIEPLEDDPDNVTFDLFQEIIEIPPDDVRNLAAAFPGCGQVTIDAIVKYADDNYIAHTGINFIRLMTDVDSKGKPAYNIKGIGKKSVEKWRGMLQLPDGFNLRFQEVEFDTDRAYNRGWREGLQLFRAMIEDGVKATEAYDKAFNCTFEFTLKP